MTLLGEVIDSGWERLLYSPPAPPVISSEDLVSIKEDVLGLLAEHGFENQIPPFLDFFKKEIEDWWGQVGAESLGPPQGPFMTPRQMDLLTMKVARIFQSKGLHMKYNEDLNSVRWMLEKLLKKLGYFSHISYTGVGWGCYREWIEIAKADGDSDEDIAKTRKWFKENQPERYEE